MGQRLRVRAKNLFAGYYLRIEQNAVSTLLLSPNLSSVKPNVCKLGHSLMLLRKLIFIP